MPPQLETPLSPLQLLLQLAELSRNAAIKAQSAKPGSIQDDTSVLQYIEALELKIMQLDYSFIRKLSDSGSINSFERLKEIEKMLNEIVEGKRLSIKQDRHLFRLAKHVRNNTKRAVGKTKRNATIKFNQIQQEKKKLTAEEKEAKENMGKKAA
jgi:hypothetical protein